MNMAANYAWSTFRRTFTSHILLDYFQPNCVDDFKVDILSLDSSLAYSCLFFSNVPTSFDN